MSVLHTSPAMTTVTQVSVVFGVWNPEREGYAHTDFYVGNCSVYRNAGIPGKGSHSGNGIVLAQVDGALIERCRAYENGGLNDYEGGGPVGIWVWDANRVVMQFNESHHNRTGSSKDGGGFDLDGGVRNSTVQYNYSHDNDGPGYLLAHVQWCPCLLWERPPPQRKCKRR